MLRLENVCVNHAGTPVLRNFNGTLETGAWAMLVGANGAGKTTLFDAISGKVQPASGRVVIDRADVTKMPEHERAAWVARLFQNPAHNCVAGMTVLENLILATFKQRKLRLRRGGCSLTRKQACDRLEQVAPELCDRLDVPMAQLSGGQRQLVSFVMATWYPPKVLLLDEPTAALDPLGATRLLAAMLRFVQSHCVTAIMITHDTALAQHVGDRLWCLQHGRMVAHGAPVHQRAQLLAQVVPRIDYGALAASFAQGGKVATVN